MVFTSLIRFGTNIKGGPRGPDRYWRRRKILRMSAHFFGRKKQCYRIAINYVHKSWLYVTRARKLRKERMVKLWNQRITAACMEHGIEYEAFRQALLRLDILLNRKVLSQLAVFEPRTFKSIVNLAMGVVKEEPPCRGINLLSSPPPPGVFTRGMLKDS